MAACAPLRAVLVSDTRALIAGANPYAADTDTAGGQAGWAEQHRRRVDAAAEAEDRRREFAAERDDLGLVIQPRLRLARIGSALVVADL